MASLKDLKRKLGAFSTEETPKEQIKKEESRPQVLSPKKDNSFELEEARYMLNLIANSDFKGRDVQTVYNIAFKLQDIVTENTK